VPFVPEGGTISGSNHFAVRSNHGPQEVESCEELAKTEAQTPVEEFSGAVYCTYYRSIISGFADIAKPLTKLTEEKQTFEWSTEAKTAFQALKNTLYTAPVLGYPQPGEKFIIDTDDSNIVIGGVLSQVQDGSERGVVYFSKTLSKAERNYCVTRRQLFAIVKTLDHIHEYLYGQEFHLRTDHSALTWLLNFRNLEGQTARWVQRLQEYNFKSEHRQGIRHTNADALSRRPCPEECSHCQKVEHRADGKRVRIVAVAAANGWD